MKRITLIITALLTVCLILTFSVGCNKTNFPDYDVKDGEIIDTELPEDEITAPGSDDMFTERDKEGSFEQEKAIKVTLTGNSATAANDSVSINGNTVTFTKKGTYLISGNLNEGQLIVEADDSDKIQLVLDGVNIEAETLAPILILSADKVFLTLKGENSLKTTGTFAVVDDNKVDGVIYSKDDLVINGDGTLNITSTSNGIVCKDDLKITGGKYSIDAKGHGIDANDSFRTLGSELTINAGKDGIHVENDEDTTKGYIYIENGVFNVISEGDAISSSYTTEIVDGSINAVTGGGSVNSSDKGGGFWGRFPISGANTSDDLSCKGIKASGNLIISKGTITIDSSDDSIHSNSSVRIQGGEFTIKSGDDGIHADSVVLIENGKIDIQKSYEGIEGKSITVLDGDITVIASDDGFNAAGGNDSSSIEGRPIGSTFSSDGSCFITISNGSIYVNAGGDGIDSNGSLFVSGGRVIVEGPTDNGNGAFDYNSTAQITGGVVLAIGSAGMAQNFSSANQGSILINLNSSKASNENIVLTDSDGNELFRYVSNKAYQSVLLSLPELTKGNTYTLTTGNTSTTVTLSSNIYGSGGMGGGGMGGGMGGGKNPPFGR